MTQLSWASDAPKSRRIDGERETHRGDVDHHEEDHQRRDRQGHPRPTTDRFLGTVGVHLSTLGRAAPTPAIVTDADLRPERENSKMTASRRTQAGMATRYVSQIPIDVTWPAGSIVTKTGRMLKQNSSAKMSVGIDEMLSDASAARCETWVA